MPDTERAYRLVRELGGKDVSQYKAAVVSRRVRARAREIGFPDEARYLDALEAGGEWARAESRSLIAGLCPNVSSFFRDPAVFAALEEFVYPELFRERAPGKPLRVWSAACSKGQEAYSLAISLRRQARRTGSPAAISVLGTDVDEAALAAARAGAYASREIEGLPPWVLEEAFEPLAEGGMVVRPEVRRLVRFQKDDVLNPETRPVGFHLVSCRNFLIYLRRPVQEDVILGLRRALVPGGFLLLGMSETVLGRPWRVLEHVSPSWRIYRRPLLF